MTFAWCTAPSFLLRDPFSFHRLKNHGVTSLGFICSLERCFMMIGRKWKLVMVLKSLITWERYWNNKKRLARLIQINFFTGYPVISQGCLDFAVSGTRNEPKKRSVWPQVRNSWVVKPSSGPNEMEHVMCTAVYYWGPKSSMNLFLLGLRTLVGQNHV